MRRCPCCGEQISFFELFFAWSDRDDDGFIHCPKCGAAIQRFEVYEKFGLIGQLPLFALLFLPQSWMSYKLALGAFVYMAALFWFLYSAISFHCFKEIPIKKDVTPEREWIRWIGIFLIFLFFIAMVASIFWALAFRRL